MNELGKGSERKYVSGLTLTVEQWALVASTLAYAINVIGMAYGRALGPDRITELIDLKRDLIQGALNMDIEGINLRDEPAVMKAVADYLNAVIPDVEHR